MEVAILVAVVGLWLLVGLLWLSSRRARPALRPTPEVDEDETALVAIETRGTVELWWPGGAKLATVTPTVGRSAGSVLRSPWTRRAVGALVQRARQVRPSGEQRYRVTFPPDLMSAVTSGGTVELVMSGRGIGAVGGAALGGPTAALAAGALALSVVQQQRLDRTLAVIEKRLDLLIDRLRDDDMGRLDAAEALLHQLDNRSTAVPSAQLRAELAVARQVVDGIYFARRRFAERLGEAIGDAQEAGSADSGRAQAWAGGVLQAVGEPEQLRSELLVYLRALVVRAQLATSTSAVLAIEGQVADAQQLLTDTVAELRTDFYALYRRFRPLAQWAPPRSVPWRRREWDRAHTTVVEVYELMAGEVEPLLPDVPDKPLELEVALDSNGAVEELRVIDD